VAAYENRALVYYWVCPNSPSEAADRLPDLLRPERQYEVRLVRKREVDQQLVASLIGKF
jgi:hypothetical protein